MLTKPTLLLDEKKCKLNIQLANEKAKNHNLQFRPHFKTHQSIEIGKWFKAVGVNKITVSSVSMANYFSTEWNDITIAFPVNILEIDDINNLAEKITLNLLVENIEGISFLSDNIKHKINVFIKIDVGYHRTGVSPQDNNIINQILNVIKLNPFINFMGFLSHAGHTYNCNNSTEILQIHNTSIRIMSELKAKYINEYPYLIISLGDTPSFSIANNFSNIDEIRSGNLVFYDLAQHQLGSCSVSQIAVAVACPIVAVHTNRNEVVVYGGSVHLSKDIITDTEGIIYGRIAQKTENGWGNIIPNTYVKSLSQEHGIISVSNEIINKFIVGNYLIILPIHSCLTANLFKKYNAIYGNNISRI